MSLSDRRDRFISDKLLLFDGITVTLKRGVNETPGVVASKGQMEYETQDSSGVVDRWRSRNFKILKTAYVINSVVVEPRRGDIIIETIDSVPYQRVVQAPPGLKHWEEDQSGYMMVVHSWERESEA